jgi:hypothetical protein
MANYSFFQAAFVGDYYWVLTLSDSMAFKKGGYCDRIKYTGGSNNERQDA